MQEFSKGEIRNGISSNVIMYIGARLGTYRCRRSSTGFKTRVIIISTTYIGALITSLLLGLGLATVLVVVVDQLLEGFLRGGVVNRELGHVQ